ncbi:MAG: hypothetical protein WCP21_08380 [Armatimonadota bacterium]
MILLDAYSSRTLACVRSLDVHGVRFAVGGETRQDMALHSRHCGERFLYTSPYISVEHFREDVSHAAARFGATTVLPTSEAAILAWSEGAEAIQRFSKRRTFGLAAAADVPVPQTAAVTAAAPRLEDVRAVGVPAVVKADSSAYVCGDRIMKAEPTAYVRSTEDLTREVERRLAAGSDTLVQQLVEGHGVGVSGVFRDGVPVALFQHRRLRESTPTGGPSALAVSVPLDSDLVLMTERLMRVSRYTGPAMVEFKVCESTGAAFLMEVNWRLWGSVLLAMAAGLDIPWLLWKTLTGREVRPEETRYRSGVVGRYLIGDTKHLALVLRGRPRGWIEAFPSRPSALREYLGDFVRPDVRELLLTADDPKPFFARLVQIGLARWPGSGSGLGL